MFPVNTFRFLPSQFFTEKCDDCMDLLLFSNDNLISYNMVVTASTEGISFTFSISESVLNSSDSSSSSSTETEESERDSSYLFSRSSCQQSEVIPRAGKRTTMPRVVSVSKANSRVRNPYIQDDDSLDEEIARMEFVNAGVSPNSRRVSAGEDLHDVFANVQFRQGGLDGNTGVAGVLDRNLGLTPNENLGALDRNSGVNQPFSSQNSGQNSSSVTNHAAASAAAGAKLAMGLRHGTLQKNITDDVQKGWDCAMENSVKYESRKHGDFERMLEIIRESGGSELKTLATETVWDGFEDVPLLVDVLRNVEDRRYFLIILDECLKFFVEFAKKVDGNVYSCGSMHQKIKHIFATLNGTYALTVKVADFKTTGTFRARISNIWTEERKVNPEFGQQKGMSEICVNDVEYVFEAIRDGVLCPKGDPYHLKLIVQFILIRLFALRATEAASLDLKNVKWKVYDFGPDRGTKFVELFIDITKVRKLKLGSWKIPKNYGKVKIRDNPEDKVFNAFELLQFYIKKLPEKKGR